MPLKTQADSWYSSAAAAASRSLLVSSVLAGAALSVVPTVQAEVASCGAKANFSVTTGKVCLPQVTVNAAGGVQTYQAQLQLLNGTGAPRFTLTEAVPVASTTAADLPTYSGVTGLLHIPVVEQYDPYGTNRYAVHLQQVPNTSPAEFELLPGAAAMFGVYTPGLTWKPYVLLQPYEKTGLNQVGGAPDFADLAVAAYDFSILTIGAWDAVEGADTATGLQGALYSNRNTGELAIAFRGTEFCILPVTCSLTQLKESQRDVLTDTLLTQGHDSGQFQDAYNFVQVMLKKYPGRKVTVTGHSLGGGLAQAVGLAFNLETYAFNSSPVPNNFFDAHGVKPESASLSGKMHVISDIHDPISNTDYSGKFYADATHIVPPVFIDFDKKEIAPTYKAELDNVRFNKHAMNTLRDNLLTMLGVYKQGW